MMNDGSRAFFGARLFHPRGLCIFPDWRTAQSALKPQSNSCADVMCEMETKNMIIGYARVSTDGQTLDAQEAALKAAGAARVFSEKVSGTVTDRKALGKALAALGQG